MVLYVLSASGGPRGYTNLVVPDVKFPLVCFSSKPVAPHFIVFLYDRPSSYMPAGREHSAAQLGRAA
jgi:hypothetical protein